MMKKNYGNLSLRYNSQYKESAELVSNNYKNIEGLICDLWGFNIPARYKIFVTDSYVRFLFATYPWYYKIVLGLSIPFWYFKVKKIWKFAGGLTLLNKNHLSIVIKPIEELAKADTSIGEKIFNKEKDQKKKVLHIITHEMVHVFSMHRKLPMWISEGIAMVTVDRFLDEQTVRNDTIKMFSDDYHQKKKLKYKDLSKASKDELAYNYGYGYWAVFYLEKEYPGFLKELFNREKVKFEKEIAEKLGINKKYFWKEFERLLFNYFGGIIDDGK